MEEEGEEARPQMPASETKGKSYTPNTPAPAPARTLKKKAIISRCTRSQAAPEWTVEETLVLVSEIASLCDENWPKALPSNQRWKMISDNCVSHGVRRSFNLCKRRWDSLLSNYAKVRIWEESHHARESRSYWSLRPSKRKRFHLPASFDRQVFGSMDAVIRAHEGLSTSMANADSEGLVNFSSSSGSSDDDDDDDGDSGDMFESDASDLDCHNALPRAKGQAQEIIGMLDAEMGAADIDSGYEEMGTRTIKRVNKEQEIGNKLRKNAKEIHAILRGEVADNATETECTRRQADELIKAFGLLVSTLDQFAELIKDGVCEGSSLMSSTTL